MTRPDLSVVIPTRDKAASLRLVLACLARQDLARPWEIVVVDDGCSDGTPALLAQAAGRLPLRTVPGPCAGRAAARNTGAAAARGPVLLFLDDDILLPPPALAAHAAAHLRPGPACVHGPLRELPGARRLLADTAGHTGRAPHAAPGPACEDAPAPHDDPYAAVASGRYGRTVTTALERLLTATSDGELPAVAPWLGCVGANTSLPYALWTESGGYDEDFGTTWGCEDLELGLRLWQSGTAMRPEPAAPGVHLTHPRADRWAQHTVNLARFTAKHPLAAVRALPELLGPSGNERRYADAVHTLERSERP
ncbi:glycosyltransferase family 2 protein [Streptomyces sp. NPDC086091]|uniref:glycosyltransferase family 2 protein n=1 Tax=Streptomyces sp. NPDC086091 TaxID=3365751 RepID=UPI003818B2F3